MLISKHCWLFLRLSPPCALSAKLTAISYTSMHLIAKTKIGMYPVIRNGFHTNKHFVCLVACEGRYNFIFQQPPVSQHRDLRCAGMILRKHKPAQGSRVSGTHTLAELYRFIHRNCTSERAHFLGRCSSKLMMVFDIIQ